MGPEASHLSAERFPPVFWAANATELFERAAYYSMASFVVLYLGQLGLGNYWPSALNGLLWFLVYFLPILSGTLADQIGFRRALLGAFALLVAGYFLMGFPVWFGGASLSDQAGDSFTARPALLLPLLLGILLIGVGGSVVKPCISGTVQKTAGSRVTLGFALFYMVINIGSLTGRGAGYAARTRLDLSAIFLVAMAGAALGGILVWRAFRGPATEPNPAQARRSIGRILLDMVRVLGNLRFALFLLVSIGFWFLYTQVYNLLPLYLKKVVEIGPAVDLYTMANPLVIVSCQLLVTRWFGRLVPVRSIVVGILIISLSMTVNLLPLLLGGDVRRAVLGLPLGALCVVLTVALVAFGELFASPRMYEFVGSFAPRGQEGLFLGYVNLPVALGALLGNLAGAAIFNEIMCRGATAVFAWRADLDPFQNGLEVLRGRYLLELDPAHNAAGWLILSGIGLLSAGGMWAYQRWLRRLPAPPDPAPEARA